ncbi:hypothetical protein FOBRF1_012084 [Fusarium oxysporum]
MEDINKAVENARVAANGSQDLTPRAGHLDTLREQLLRRFSRSEAIEDLNEAIEVTENLVTITAINNPKRPRRLYSLGTLLATRFEHQKAIQDLDRAIELYKASLNLLPPNSPRRAFPLSGLGTLLEDRFKHTRAIEDLHRAVELAEESVNITHETHRSFGIRLAILGNILFSRYQEIGRIEDLNRAVALIQIGLDCLAPDHSDRPSILNNLAEALGRRFMQTGRMQDLNLSVELAQEAVDVTPKGQFRRAARLGTLGSQLFRRFRETQTTSDLQSAIEAGKAALDLTPSDHPRHGGRLSNLGFRLKARYEHTGAEEDLDQAIKLTEAALRKKLNNHFQLAGMSHNLAQQLGARFERNKESEDLDRTILIAKEAVDATRPGHPERATRFAALGSWLGTRFEIFKATADLEESISSFKEGLKSDNSPPSDRITLAWNAGTFYASQLEWELSSEFFEEAVRLLPTVSPRWLQHIDKQRILAEFAGLASMAASTALKVGKDASHALQLLELGRGVVAGLLMEMRADVSDLEKHHPILAKEFKALRDTLDSPFSESQVGDNDQSPEQGSFYWEARLNRYREAEHEFRSIIENIRTQQGFGNFLRLPTLSDLKAAADVGPIIVINMSPYGCDAFLVTCKEVFSIQLPALSIGEVQENVDSLKSSHSTLTSVLAWLWDVVAHPCLQSLGLESATSIDNKWQRVWWIPTGLLTELPIHAAGRHFGGSQDTVLDRAVSSYGSSIKAIIQGRQRKNIALSTEAEDALLVGMLETPKQPILRFAAREVSLVNKLLTSQPIGMPSQLVQPPHQSRSYVLEHLRSCKIFHFAGHGESHPSEPTSSRLLLADWETHSLTVGDLRDLRLQENSPYLAYLSACSTGTNKFAPLVDESVHLISACQLAGFRNVIGTLWEVNDEYCVYAAREVYKSIGELGFTDEAVAVGTHKAVRLLQDLTRSEYVRPGYARRLEGDPSIWAAYIHFGP